jgi:inner membrane transporter RhtA
MGVAMVSVQFGAAFAKRLFPVVGAEGATAMRVSLAAVMLVALMRPWRRWPTKRAWPVLLAFGVALGAMNLCFYAALQTIPLGIAVGLEFIGPLAVAMLASRRGIDFLWIALAAAGLAVLLPLGHSAEGLDPRGVALALGAGVFWGLYIVLGKKAGAGGGGEATAVGMVVAAIVVAPIGLARADMALFTPSILLTGAVVALFSSAAPYSLEMFAMRHMPTRVFGTLMSAEPAIATLMGLALLGERLTLRQGLAIGAIILASVGATVTMRGDVEAEPLSP